MWSLTCNFYFFLADRGGCPSPGLTLNGTRVVPRSGMSPDFSTLSEVKFPARLPSPSGKGSVSVASSSSAEAETPSRICKIKCVSGQWVGPLCQGPYTFNTICLYIHTYYYSLFVFVLISIRKNKLFPFPYYSTILFYNIIL